MRLRNVARTHVNVLPFQPRITYIFIFLGDSISRRIAIYISTPSLRKRLALLGLAMGLIIAGLYLESLAIAIIIPLAIFMIFWGNGTIYGLTANHVDKQVPESPFSCKLETFS